MSRAPLRLRTALTLAAVGHVLATLSVLVLPSPPSPRSPAAVVQEITLASEVDPLEAVEGASSAAPRDESDTVRAKTLPAARARDVVPSSSSEPAPVAAGEIPAADPTWSFDPLRRSPADLGIGSHWRTVARDGARAGAGAAGVLPSASVRPEEDARERARSIDRSMREMLTARDVELGLGRAGPLVAATHAAASAPTAPEVGVTILEVESDAAGIVVAARAEDGAWSTVASAVVRQMAGKPLRVRPGGRGLRARLRVVAERALPAGAHGTSHAGAVPDDVPGGGKACVGEGLSRRCAAGLPAGVTKADSDLSNVGQKPKRVVHVQLLGESEL